MFLTSIPLLKLESRVVTDSSVRGTSRSALPRTPTGSSLILSLCIPSPTAALQTGNCDKAYSISTVCCINYCASATYPYAGMEYYYQC